MRISRLQMSLGSQESKQEIWWFSSTILVLVNGAIGAWKRKSAAPGLWRTLARQCLTKRFAKSRTMSCSARANFLACQTAVSEWLQQRVKYSLHEVNLAICLTGSG